MSETVAAVLAGSVAFVFLIAAGVFAAAVAADWWSDNHTPTNEAVD